MELRIPSPVVVCKYSTHFLFDGVSHALTQVVVDGVVVGILSVERSWFGWGRQDPNNHPCYPSMVCADRSSLAGRDPAAAVA